LPARTSLTELPADVDADAATTSTAGNATAEAVDVTDKRPAVIVVRRKASAAVEADARWLKLDPPTRAQKKSLSAMTA
jgi:hypothetical protein